MTEADALAALRAGSNTAPTDEDQALAVLRAGTNPPESVPHAQTTANTAPAPDVIPQEVPLIALGHWFDRMAAGLRQKTGAIPYVGPAIAGAVDKMNNVAPFLGPNPSTDPAVQQANEAEYSKLQAAKPAGTFIGDAAAGVAAKSPLGMATLGALEYGTPGQSLLRGLVNLGGGYLGMGLAKGVEAAARGAAPADATVRAAQDFADTNGGVLTRGQISGSPFTQRLEKMLASLPGSGSFYKNAAQANAAASRQGMDAVTGGNAGKLIQQAGEGKAFTVDAPFVSDMRSIADRFSGVADRDAPNGALKTIDQYVGTSTPNPALASYPPAVQKQMIAQGVPEFIGKTPPKYAVGDTMPMVGPYGDFSNYQGLRSLYGYRANAGGDPTDKAAYNLIQDAFDNAAQRSLVAHGADANTMKAVQQAYAAQKIAQPARVVAADGTVTYDPTKLATAVAKVEAKKPGMIDNLGDAGTQLRQLAAFGQVATPLKSSGTAEGNIAGHVATGGIGLLGGALADVMTGGSLLHHAGAAAAGAASLYAMPRIINAAVQGTRNGAPLLRELPQFYYDLLNRGVTGLLGAGPAAAYLQ